MQKGDFNKKTGFTIIEASLVLAVAGLIFLMVFIALPSLQRGQRDAKRREDIDTLLTAIKKYQTNNRGALPTGTGEITRDAENAGDSTWGGFLRDYVSDRWEDPNSGEAYKLKVATCNTEGSSSTACKGYGMNDMQSDYTIQIVLQASCAGDESVGAVKASNPRKLAALYKLEGGGVYCANT